MQINGPGYIHGAQSVGGPHGVKGPQRQQPSSEAKPVQDELELSEASRTGATDNVSDIRTDKVDRIKAEIAAGTYETHEKMSLALDRMLDEI
jgi:negative regulator of flagellin synthesis FlgM